MDDTASAIIAMTTEIGNLKGAIGELTGKTAGLGREMGDLKSLITSNNSNCGRCSDEIHCRIDKVDSKVEDLKAHGAAISQENAQDIIHLNNEVIPGIDKRVKVVEKHCESEQSVSMWKEKSLREIVSIVGAVSGVIGIMAVVVGWVLHFIWTGSLM